MTYRRAIMSRNGSIRSIQADAAAMLARTSLSYSEPRIRRTPAIARCVSVKSRMLLTMRSTRLGLPYDRWMMMPAIRQSSGEGGATRAASAKLDTECTFDDLRNAPRRHRSITHVNGEARKRFSRNGRVINSNRPGIAPHAIAVAPSVASYHFDGRRVPIPQSRKAGLTGPSLCCLQISGRDPFKGSGNLVRLSEGFGAATPSRLRKPVCPPARHLTRRKVHGDDLAQAVAPIPSGKPDRPLLVFTP